MKKILPSYMLPSMISIIDSIPLTTNGKINYSALTDIFSKKSNNIIPKTNTELKLYTLFCELLDIKTLNIDDSFFDLGGHSLLGAKLINKIYQECNIELPIAILFQYPSIAELSKVIDKSGTIKNKTIDTSALNIDSQIADKLVIQSNIQINISNDSEPKFILLTGATGFLGAFLVNALLMRYNEAIIYCLVRANSTEEADKRIYQNLLNYKLNHLIENDRIKSICGDLSLNNLGLSSEKFNELAAKIDCIYHNGAKISGVSSYDELKKTNIKGTYEIIRLANHFKIKPVHYISTLAVALNNNCPEKVTPEQKRLKANEVLPNGYTQNKWVEEEMLYSVHKKGLPISIYRPGRISGASKNGIGSLNDGFWQLVSAMLKLEAVPVFENEENLFIDLIPVDYVANAIVHFSCDSNFNGKTTNLFHQLEFALLINTLQDMGYYLEKIDSQLWKEKLKQFAHQNNNEKQLQKAFLLSDSLEDIFKFSSINYCTNMIKNEVKQNKIKAPKVESQLLMAYITHFIKTDFFPAPQLQK